MSVNVIMRLTLIKESTYVTVQFDFKHYRVQTAFIFFFIQTRTESKIIRNEINSYSTLQFIKR